MALDPSISPTAKAVFMAIKAYVKRTDDNGGVAWPSTDKIVNYTGISKRVIYRCTKELELSGYIKKTKTVGGSNKYEMHYFPPGTSAKNDTG